MIPNHYSPNVSQLDETIIKSVKPGGNWKDVPESVPSKRIAQIRESCKQGKGSRSTYYGRLHPDFPSYTMNTYISRPGNGCHIHYSQDRLISQREAARFQSFPDDFVFFGSKSSINTQIGNAVPVLLAFQVANGFSQKGIYIDLFSGAGGLSLGFKWAGWKPILANDHIKDYLDTYAHNIHPEVVLGDIRDESIFKTLKEKALIAKKNNPGKPLLIVGGPPCQGFSTAGNKRTMDDERNHLFKEFVRFIQEVRPDAFIFENVTGILNMDGGKVFAFITESFKNEADNIQVLKLSAEQFAVPQRRKRIMIVGTCGDMEFSAPVPLCYSPGTVGECGLSRYVTAKEALDDLPPLIPGEDGSGKSYLCQPSNSYQKLMRGAVTADQYLAELI